MTGSLKYKAVLLLLVFLSFSCQDLEKTERPADLIPEAKMVDVLTEMALLNAARNYNKQKLESTGIKPDDYIFKRFGIDSLQFERSNDYYAEQYTQYERIYDSVKNRIQNIKSRMDSLREIEIKIEDSIKLAEKDSLRETNSLNKDSLRVKDSLKTDSLKLKRIEELRDGRDSLVVPPKAVQNSSSMNRN
ncbi:hypothetical protein GCM10023115_30180 [Pontixanthobacter gangjinensis]|uniref:DUF4296 domain-containing protein n=1 Tax=Christiangramia aestuarii TaxID=1028746 RepID=A0A7K1LNY1_9FLAO|nr:DUF4296 domain-containing protein [Christiangramia aestuarii]MUP42250.1 DUF4296 domain-containing protein [Christiangramia aestuarii]